MNEDFEYRIVLREYADPNEFDGMSYVVQTKVEFTAGERWLDMKKFASVAEAQRYLKRVQELGGNSRDTVVKY